MRNRMKHAWKKQERFQKQSFSRVFTLLRDYVHKAKAEFSEIAKVFTFKNKVSLRSLPKVP